MLQFASFWVARSAPVGWVVRVAWVVLCAGCGGGGGSAASTGGSGSSAPANSGGTTGSGQPSSGTGGSTAQPSGTGGATEPPATGSCTADATVYNGHVTSYSVGSGPACHTGTNNLPQYTAAMNEQDYNKAAACGACVEVTNSDNGQKLVVTIIDLCPVAGNEQWCFNGSHHVDLAEPAYAAIGANNNPAVTWRYVSCQSAGNIEYVWEASATQYWLAFTVKNHTNPIQTVELKGAGAYVAMTRADYNVFSTQDSLGAGPYTVRVTDVYGNVIEDSLALQPGSTVTGTKQLPRCN